MINFPCICSHSKEKHITSSKDAVRISALSIFNKFGSWCQECPDWHDFKKDNLRYLEEKYNERLHKDNQEVKS